MQRSPTSIAVQERPFVIVGAGGLGCPAILGLVASGVRNLTIVDPDLVETSNLQRQILYRHCDRGRSKSAVAFDRIRELEPEIQITTQRLALAPEHIHSWLNKLPQDAVILECSDDAKLKFAVNDASVRTGRSCIIGGVLGLKGHIMAIQGSSACFRCIFESPPPAELNQNCNVAGILSSVAGVIGYWMAHFAVLVLSDDSIGGTLLAYDLLDNDIRRLRPRPNSECMTCATRNQVQTTRSNSIQIEPSIAN